MIDDEKYIEVRNKLLQLPKVKASDDFLIKLQHKINLSADEVPVSAPRRSFFRRYVLVPSLSFGSIIITGVIVWALFLHSPANEFTNTRISPGQQIPQNNQNTQTPSNQNFAAQTNTNSPQQNSQIDEQSKQNEQTVNNDNIINRLNESSPIPIYNMGKPSERVTPNLQVQEEKLKEDKTIRDSRIPDVNPIISNPVLQQGVDYEKSNKMFVPETQKKVQPTESPMDSRKGRSKDILDDNSVMPDKRETGVTNSKESQNPVSTPERKTDVTKSDKSPVTKDKSPVTKDKSGTIKKDSTKIKMPTEKSNNNTTAKPKTKNNSTPKNKQEKPKTPKQEPNKSPKDSKQNN